MLRLGLATAREAAGLRAVRFGFVTDTTKGPAKGSPVLQRCFDLPATYAVKVLTAESSNVSTCGVPLVRPRNFSSIFG